MKIVEAGQVWDRSGTVVRVVGKIETWEMEDRWAIETPGSLTVAGESDFQKWKLLTNADGTPAEPPKPEFKLLPLAVDPDGRVLVGGYEIWPHLHIWPDGLTLIGFTDDESWRPEGGLSSSFWRWGHKEQWFVLYRFAVFAKVEAPR